MGTVHGSGSREVEGRLELLCGLVDQCEEKVGFLSAQVLLRHREINLLVSQTGGSKSARLYGPAKPERCQDADRRDRGRGWEIDTADCLI